ncbi:MAG: thioredoxin TrxC [Acidobacteriota bacterium]
MNTSAEAQVIRCPQCGAANRVQLEKLRSGHAPVCGKCHTPLLNETHPLTITDANFAREVEQSPLPVLLDFWAAWCGPCRLIAPIIEQLAGELAGRVRVGKLNTDENQMTAARFNVRSIPTLILFRDGREIDRIAGAVPKEMIVRKLQANGLW